MFSSYYKWLHAIIRDDVEPQKTLKKILCTINPQERLSFLNYLMSEYREGMVDELLEIRFEYDTANNREGYAAGEFNMYTPAEASYLLLCSTADAIKNLFNNYVPSLLKTLDKSFHTSTIITPMNPEPVYDDKEEYLTTPEAAAFLRIEQGTLHHYVSRGINGVKLTRIKVGKNNLYKMSDLKKLYKRGSYRNEELEYEMQMEYDRMKKRK